jgi:hypothetical protein
MPRYRLRPPKSCRFGALLARNKPGIHETVRKFHNTALIRPRARRGRLRYRNLSGPGRRQLRIPQPPSPPGFEPTGPFVCDGSIPFCSGPACRPVFFAELARRIASVAGSALRDAQRGYPSGRPSCHGVTRWPACAGHDRSEMVGWNDRTGVHRIDWIAAPSILLGWSSVPVCTITASASMPFSANPAVGTLNECSAPFHSPSRNQRRTTL